jgi:tRNA(Ile)-lysidine synthase
MSASHRPTLRTLAERSLRDECRVERGEKVLLAVSGGVDSTALLHVMASLSDSFGLELHAHGVDHGLRSEAPEELDQVERLATTLNVPFTRTNVQVPKGANLQARARNERFGALRHRALELGARWIATAHHADDRAETVLIRLMRGSGPVGLGVLGPQQGDLIRPLIRASRLDIIEHLERHQLPYSVDPSNCDPHYLRTRIRIDILPRLIHESPGIVDHLNALADRMLELAEDNPLNSLALSRSQAEELKHMLRNRRDMAEIALGEGWVVKLEKRKLRSSQ